MNTAIIAPIIGRVEFLPLPLPMNREMENNLRFIPCSIYTLNVELYLGLAVPFK